MYKKAPDKAKNAIVDLFNTIWQSGEIPKQFKHGIVIPIKKEDKPGSDPASYRPITLTSHLGKLLETIINRRLNKVLTKLKIIHKNQSGFRHKRQTHDHIIRLTHDVNKGRNYGTPIAAVFLDLEKAFDTIWREGTLEELQEIGITGNTYNYISSFLSDRTFQVRVGNTLSDTKTQVNGVPQGAVISPTIFNILINKVNKLQNHFPNTKMGQLADDNAIWTTVNSVAKNCRKEDRLETVRKKIEKPVNMIMKKLKSLGYKVNVPKTQAILFNTQEEITLNLDNQQVKTQKEAKYLG